MKKRFYGVIFDGVVGSFGGRVVGFVVFLGGGNCLIVEEVLIRIIEIKVRVNVNVIGIGIVGVLFLI